MTDPMDLSDEVVMITGASRGLGRALADACAEAGSRLVLCARGAGDLDRATQTLRDRGAEAVARPADVTDPEAVRRLVAEAGERLGAVTVLINNASVLGERVPLRDYPLDEWRRVMDINVAGALNAARAVLPGMREAGRGSIINVSSGVGNRARADWGAYGVSKWAVEALTWNLALEEEDAGVRVNAVDPGSMQTEMRREAYPGEDPKAPTPPSAVTGVFLWLASDASRGTTGERFRAQDWTGPGG